MHAMNSNGASYYTTRKVNITCTPVMHAVKYNLTMSVNPLGYRGYLRQYPAAYSASLGVNFG